DGARKACLAFSLHPFSVSAKFDGVKKACLALALHPFSVSTNSDGVPDKKRSNSYHRFSAWAESDGSPSKSAQITYIHLRFQSNPMESKPYTAKSGSIQVWLQANSDGEHATAPSVLKRGRRILLINQQGRRPLFVSKSCFFFDFSDF
ncbi:MAG: hypothetical protein IKF93_02150, partial [Lachnospiraceae bacterium]|nr:hypothetical protein [Lachnospiraceae bacterium]